MFMGMLFVQPSLYSCSFARIHNGCIYTYQRGPLRCLSLSEGNAKAKNVG